MFELFDELGKEHIRTLKGIQASLEYKEAGERTMMVFTTRYPKGANIGPIVPPDVGEGSGGLFHLLSAQDEVLRALKAHGLVELGEPAPITGVHGDFMAKYNMKGFFYREFALTPRGEEFLSRRLMVWAMGWMSARANKWAAFVAFSIAFMSAAADVSGLMKGIAECLWGLT